ncbi:glycoside hydrolase family 43 protein [Chitinophaga filiformis]|uniref:glycoside hydrolase family 43 protein n=1 Tax=Chitinophaga filiformis TaxID=104663 RepID=UPI001F3FC106|nr:glycoside hydrolase family 43 protein [Chitinophaga filiformis]MCF6405464.1 glycoside hydrolase family 43 protein [Chitinophaga filiformis]
MSHSALVPANPIIKHKFTTDPTAIVFDNVVYLYTGHDQAPIGVEDYVMEEWLCFSSPDLIHWTEHAVGLRAKDFKWSSGGAFASKMIYNEGRFYWYVAVKHAGIGGTAIGVAVSDQPTGGFKDARGAALISMDMLPNSDTNEKANLDPTVLVDDDGAAYIFWGNQRCYYAKLGPDLISLEGGIHTIDLPGFEEGSHLHKRNGWYYLSYGFGMPEKVAYAMSRSIHGPWTFKGILNEIAGNCQTNRPCILDFKGESYFFYHNGALENGGSHHRSVCIDRLFYNDDNTIKRVIMTSEGVQQ